MQAAGDDLTRGEHAPEPEGYGGHAPVLLEETLTLLGVRPGGHYCDATLGGGGHARAVLERSAPDGRLFAIDHDAEAIEHGRRELAAFGERLRLRQGSFAELRRLVADEHCAPFDGVVADLGVSSHQLGSARRGFSFAAEGPLDMRMDQSAPVTAERLIAESSEPELATILRDYGEERHWRRLARVIKQAHRARELRTTADLARLVWRAVGGRGSGAQRSRVHPATRVFQALRIAVNDEIGALRAFLEQVFDVLRPGGVVAVIAFHSLEDREVKQHFRAAARPSRSDPWSPTAAGQQQPFARLLTPRPLRPAAAELDENPRARSARLRAAEKLPC
ncbi:MAG: 16S rRNA (cytosine(1402)-N(4))-methyltransferase RsmH [Proteobacteria bacterium]|nr:16S rRNA (cytosine(1402)-N(4))-methyltransferase RsmH [Pseudomonadota bacterium]